MPKAPRKSTGGKGSEEPPSKVTKMDSKEGEKPEQKSEKKVSTVQGLLRAARIKCGANKVPPAGTRKSVLALPSDFGSAALQECLDPEYYSDDEDVDPPKPFVDLDYDDENHPPGRWVKPATEDIALLVNKIWCTLQKDLPKVYKSCPRPANLNTYRVDLNDEVLQLPTFTKAGRSRDMRLRAAQGAMAGAANLAVANLQHLASLESASEQQTVKLLTQLVSGTVSSLRLLSHANMSINNSRKELIKSYVNKKYHSMSKPTTTKESKWLFGEDLSTKLKALEKAIKIGRTSFGFGYNKGRRYNNFGQQNNRNRGFLGEFSGSYPTKGVTVQKQMNEHVKMSDNMAHNRFDLNFNATVVSFRPRQGPSEPRARLPEEQSELDTSESSDLEMEALVGKLPPIEIDKWPVYQAGRASMCINEWRKLTSDRIILKHVQGLIIDFVNVPFQCSPPRPIHLSYKERQYLHNELRTLLDMGVIEKTNHSPGEFISSIFLRPKKQAGKYRLILNLKDLNYEVEYHHFKMDTLETALRLVTPGCYMISIDIKDAYYTLRIHEAFRKYLRFEVDGQLYQFTCLPNGLACGPRWFTKLLKVPLAYLREQYDINTSAYIDDLLVTHDNFRQCHMSARKIVQVLQNLGFTISSKSTLRPTQVIEHVGFVINSTSMKVYLPQDKIDNISGYIRQCLKKQSLTIREVAQLLGKLEATKPGNRFASLYTKTLTWEKNAALAQNYYDFDGRMSLSKQVKAELQWWLQHLPTVYADIFVGQPNETIFTDASQAGWGCHAPFCDKKFGGRWTIDEQQYHINVLELLAILYSLKAVCRHLHDVHLRIMTDNTTAMLCITNQGSVHSSECNDVVRQIWIWAQERNIWLSAAHIPGEDNVTADNASRKFADDSEWELNDSIFQQICAEFGQPDIDLFASRLNRKVEQFCSWHPDPEAKFVDAFTINWSQYLGYAFPPFAVLPAMMQKIKMEGAQVIVVVPKWPTKPWFTVMKSMIVGEMVEIPVTNDTLLLPSRRKTDLSRTPVCTRGHQQIHQQGRQQHHHQSHQQIHPLAGQLTLMVGRLSGRPLPAEAIHLE